MATSKTVTLNILGDASGANKSMDAVGAKAQSTGSKLKSTFSSMFSNLSSSGLLGPLGEQLDQIGGLFDRLGEKSKSLGGKMLGMGAAGLGAGGLLMAAASGDKAAHQQLQQAVETTGKDYGDYKDAIERAIKSQAKFGNTAKDTQEALQILTQATNDPAKALQYLGTASDLAAAKHESLATAAGQLGKAYNGATKILKEFGLEAAPKAKMAATQLESATKGLQSAQDAAAKAQQKLTDLETIDAGKKKVGVAGEIALRTAHDAVTTASAKVVAAQEKLTKAQETAGKAASGQTDTMAALAKKLHGQADAAADTFTGRLKALRAEVENHVAAFGQKYGPAITAAGAGFTVLGGAIDGAKTVMGVFKTTQEATTAATEGLTAAEDAEVVSEYAALGPILLIIAAVAALGVGIYELITHWHTVWNAVKGAVVDAWHFITGIISTVVDWISGHWQLLLAILTGPIGLAVLWIKDHFHQIVDFAGDVVHGVVNCFTGLPGQIFGALGGIVGWFFNLGSNIVHAMISGIGSMAGAVGSAITSLLPHSVLGIKLPWGAQGGIVTKPTIVGVGEAGPEALIPLNDPARATQILGAAGLSSGTGPGYQGAGRGGGGDIILNVPLSIDGRQVGLATARYTRDELIRMGRSNPTILSGVGSRS